MIALVDYGAGNLASVRKALASLGVDLVIPQSPSELSAAAGIIVPGVGHFDRTRALDASWRTAFSDSLSRGAALFGICLGMQWLFEGSAEAPGLPGLGLFSGFCVDLATISRPAAATRSVLKVPHVGWNELDVRPGTSLMRGIESRAQVYFTHSYVAPVIPEHAAITTYGMPFTSAVELGRIAGVQFHPEKSGAVGLRILRNWLDVV